MSSKNRTRITQPVMTKEELMSDETNQVSNKVSDIPEEVQSQSNEEIIKTDTNIIEEVKVEETVKVKIEIQPKQTVQIQPEEGFKPVFKVELDLNSYAEAMDKNKSIVPEEGGRWQYSLFTSIKNVLSNTNQQQFNKEWNTILVFFHKNKNSIFNEKFIFRFPEYWTGSDAEFTAFRRIVYTIIQTADPITRKKAISQINLDLLVNNLTENQRNNLISFYA